MSTQEERDAIAHFLRTRRERLSPAQAGLAANTRRRTPGLRREEVAQLAGISVTWYTWLEQGRDIKVSTQVLENLAAALQLQPYERDYLFTLATIYPVAAPITIDEPLPTVIQKILDHQGDYPAYILGRYWDVLAWNQAASLLFGDFSQMESRNMLWYMFVRPETRQLVVNWQERAQRLLAEFRADCSHYITEPSFIQFVDRLKQSSNEFATWWPLHNIHAREGGRRDFDHPMLGRIAFYQTTFYVSHTPTLKMILHIPENKEY